jgi:hypothetical protein
VPVAAIDSPRGQQDGGHDFDMGEEAAMQQQPPPPPRRPHDSRMASPPQRPTGRPGRPFAAAASAPVAGGSPPLPPASIRARRAALPTSIMLGLWNAEGLHRHMASAVRLLTGHDNGMPLHALAVTETMEVPGDALAAAATEEAERLWRERNGGGARPTRRPTLRWTGARHPVSAAAGGAGMRGVGLLVADPTLRVEVEAVHPSGMLSLSLSRHDAMPVALIVAYVPPPGGAGVTAATRHELLTRIAVEHARLVAKEVYACVMWAGDWNARLGDAGGTRVTVDTTRRNAAALDTVLTAARMVAVHGALPRAGVAAGAAAAAAAARPGPPHGRWVQPAAATCRGIMHHVVMTAAAAAAGDGGGGGGGERGSHPAASPNAAPGGGRYQPRHQHGDDDDDDDDDDDAVAAEEEQQHDSGDREAGAWGRPPGDDPARRDAPSSAVAGAAPARPSHTAEVDYVFAPAGAVGGMVTPLPTHALRVGWSTALARSGHHDPIAVQVRLSARAAGGGGGGGGGAPPSSPSAASSPGGARESFPAPHRTRLAPYLSHEWLTAGFAQLAGSLAFLASASSWWSPLQAAAHAQRLIFAPVLDAVLPANLAGRGRAAGGGRAPRRPFRSWGPGVALPHRVTAALGGLRQERRRVRGEVRRGWATPEAGRHSLRLLHAARQALLRRHARDAAAVAADALQRRARRDPSHFQAAVRRLGRATGGPEPIPDAPGQQPAVGRFAAHFARATAEDRGEDPAAALYDRVLPALTAALAGGAGGGEHPLGLRHPARGGEPFLQVTPELVLACLSGATDRTMCLVRPAGVGGAGGDQADVCGCQPCRGYDAAADARQQHPHAFPLPKPGPCMRPGASSGPFGIPSSVLTWPRLPGKELRVAARYLLCSAMAAVLNIAFRHHVWPAASPVLLTAVTPVYKGDPDDPVDKRADPRNYRPIASNPCPISRLASTAVLSLLIPWAESRGLLSPGQAGFRPGRGVEGHIAALQAAARALGLAGMELLLVFLDLVNAFGEVHLPTLHAILAAEGMPAPLRRLLADREARSYSTVVVNGVLTPAFPTLRGVLQGDPLSGLLFNLYLEGMLRAVAAKAGPAVDLLLPANKAAAARERARLAALDAQPPPPPPPPPPPGGRDGGLDGGGDGSRAALLRAEAAEALRVRAHAGAAARARLPPASTLTSPFVCATCPPPADPPAVTVDHVLDGFAALAWVEATRKREAAAAAAAAAAALRPPWRRGRRPGGAAPPQPETASPPAPPPGAPAGGGGGGGGALLDLLVAIHASAGLGPVQDFWDACHEVVWEGDLPDACGPPWHDIIPPPADPADAAAWRETPGVALRSQLCAARASLVATVRRARLAYQVAAEMQRWPASASSGWTLGVQATELVSAGQESYGLLNGDDGTGIDPLTGQFTDDVWESWSPGGSGGGGSGGGCGDPIGDGQPAAARATSADSVGGSSDAGDDQSRERATREDLQRGGVGERAPHVPDASRTAMRELMEDMHPARLPGFGGRTTGRSWPPITTMASLAQAHRRAMPPASRGPASLPPHPPGPRGAAPLPAGGGDGGRDRGGPASLPPHPPGPRGAAPLSAGGGDGGRDRGGPASLPPHPPGPRGAAPLSAGGGDGGRDRGGPGRNEAGGGPDGHAEWVRRILAPDGGAVRRPAAPAHDPPPGHATERDAARHARLLQQRADFQRDAANFARTTALVAGEVDRRIPASVRAQLVLPPRPANPLPLLDNRPPARAPGSPTTFRVTKDGVWWRAMLAFADDLVYGFACRAHVDLFVDALCHVAPALHITFNLKPGKTAVMLIKPPPPQPDSPAPSSRDSSPPPSPAPPPPASRPLPHAAAAPAQASRVAGGGGGATSSASERPSAAPPAASSAPAPPPPAGGGGGAAAAAGAGVSAAAAAGGGVGAAAAADRVAAAPPGSEAAGRRSGRAANLPPPVPLPRGAPVAGWSATGGSSGGAGADPPAIGFVTSYKYLGNLVRDDMSEEGEGGRRAGAAWLAFHRVFSSNPVVHLLGMRQKLQLLRSEVLPVLTWCLGARVLPGPELARMTAALRAMLRRVLGMASRNNPNLITLAAAVGLAEPRVEAASASARLAATFDRLGRLDRDYPAPAILAAYLDRSRHGRWTHWGVASTARRSAIMNPAAASTAIAAAAAGGAHHATALAAMLRRALSHQHWRAATWRQANPRVRASKAHFQSSMRLPARNPTIVAQAVFSGGAARLPPAPAGGAAEEHDADDDDDEEEEVHAAEEEEEEEPAGGASWAAIDKDLTWPSNATPHPRALTVWAWWGTPISRAGPGGVGLLAARSRFAATDVAFLLRIPMGRRALYMAPADTGFYCMVWMHKFSLRPPTLSRMRRVLHSNAMVPEVAASHQLLADMGAQHLVAIAAQAPPAARQLQQQGQGEARVGASHGHGGAGVGGAAAPSSVGASAGAAAPAAGGARLPRPVAALPPVLARLRLLPDDGGPLPVYLNRRGGSGHAVVSVDLDSEDMAAVPDLREALALPRATLNRARAMVGAMVELQCGLPGCRGAREDTYHLITECTGRNLAEVRHHEVRAHVPALMEAVFGILSRAADGMHAPRLPEPELRALAQSMDRVRRTLRDDGSGLLLNTTEGKWVLFRCVAALPWSAGDAGPGHNLARGIGAIFDAVTLPKSAVNRIADVWVAWSLAASNALIRERKEAYRYAHTFPPEPVPPDAASERWHEEQRRGAAAAPVAGGDAGVAGGGGGDDDDDGSGGDDNEGDGRGAQDVGRGRARGRLPGRPRGGRPRGSRGSRRPAAATAGHLASRSGGDEGDSSVHPSRAGDRFRGRRGGRARGGHRRGAGLG